MPMKIAVFALLLTVSGCAGGITLPWSEKEPSVREVYADFYRVDRIPMYPKGQKYGTDPRHRVNLAMDNEPVLRFSEGRRFTVVPAWHGATIKISEYRDGKLINTTKHEDFSSGMEEVEISSQADKAEVEVVLKLPSTDDDYEYDEVHAFVRPDLPPPAPGAAEREQAEPKGEAEKPTDGPTPPVGETEGADVDE